MHYGEPVAQGRCFIHVVRGHEDGHTRLLHCFQLLPHAIASLRVKAGRGLVEHDYLRISYEGPGYCKSSFHTAGKAIDVLFRLVGKVKEHQHGVRSSLRLCTRESGDVIQTQSDCPWR